MERHHVHRLIILDEKGRAPVGIFSTTDLVRAVTGLHHSLLGSPAPG
jgi:CBS domain-containing protein